MDRSSFPRGDDLTLLHLQNNGEVLAHRCGLADLKQDRYGQHFGKSDRPGIDYLETFSPVAGHPTIGIFLSIAALEGRDLRQIDAVSAFLNAKLNEQVYLTIPPYASGHQDGKVWRLNKALYGLKQGGRHWWLELATALIRSLS